MKTFHACSCVVRHGLLAALCFALSPSAWADVPTTAILSGSRACSVSVVADGSPDQTLSLSRQTTADDGGQWYGGTVTDRTWLNVGTRFSSSLTGYLTAWYTYGTAPTKVYETGPRHMTKLIAGTNEFVVTASMLDKENPTLYPRAGMSATDFYAKFTPIVYNLSYDLAGGDFRPGTTNPATARYDEPFAVSAPVRDYYAFAGWLVGQKLYFDGESNDVTMVNLTAVNGATVSIGATWVGRPFPLYLSLGDGVAKIHYRTSESSPWLETEESLTVTVAYGATWSAWAEAKYGWEGSGTGWDPEGVTGGSMTEKGDRFKPEATRKKFTVTAKPNPTDGGSVTGSGSYDYETQVELTATAAKGHSFTGWSTGSNENPLKVQVLCATNVTAKFARNSYRLKLNVPEGVSNVWYRIGGEGDFTPVGDTCQISVPYGAKYECYATTVYGWSISGIGSSEENLWSGTMPDGDLAFVPTPTRNTYRLQLAVAPAGSGLASGSGFYEFEASAYLTANAETGYRFTGWSDGSTENPHWYTVVSNTTIAANFVAKMCGLELVVGEGVAQILYQLQDGETWLGEQSTDISTTVEVAYGTRYRLWAETEPGYELTGSGASKGSAVTGSAKTDGTVFEPKPTKISYRLALVVQPSGSGTLTGGGTYSYGSTAKLQAQPAAGYAFASWSDGTAENPYNYTVLSNATLTANFTVKDYGLRLVVGEGVAKILYQTAVGDEDWPAEWQATDVDKTVPVAFGARYRAYAEAKAGYSLTGSGSSIGSAVAGTMTTDGFVFEPKPTKAQYRVSLTALPADAGEVSGSGSYAYNAVATLQALPKDGYVFASWSDGTKENPYRLTVTNETVLTATFAVKTYTLQLIAGEGVAQICYRYQIGDVWLDWATGASNVEIPFGSRYEAYADTRPGYTLTGAGSSKGTPFAGTMGTAGAVFEPKPEKGSYSVVAVTSPSEGGTTSVQPVGMLSYGDRVTAEVTVKEGYTLVRWDETKSGRTDVSRSPVYSFTVTNDASLVAVLAKETYSVTFVYMLSSGIEYSDIQSVAYGESAVEPSAEKRNNWPGHTFVKWDDSSWQTVTRDMTIHAEYADGGYTVRFDANGGTGAMSEQAFTCGEEKALAANAFARTGYAFDGWSTDAEAKTRQYRDQQTVKDLASSGQITLYAVWTPISYIVRYEPGSAEGEAYEEYRAYDEVFTLPTSPFSSTVPLTAWLDKKTSRRYAAGESVTRLSSVAGDSGKVTLYAQWGKGCQVRFHANWDGADPGRQYAYQSFSNDVESALSANTFVRKGYTFAGWSDAVDATSSSRQYKDQELVNSQDDPIADAGETLDLYAIWKTNTYQVVFDGNEYVPELTEKDPDDENLLAHNHPILCSNGAAYEIENNFKDSVIGRVFVGWDTNKYATAENVLFSSIDEKTNKTNTYATVTFSDRPPNDHIRLYAIWNPPTRQEEDESANNANEAPLLARAAALVDAAPSPRLTGNALSTSTQLTWTNDGWENLGSGVYSNGNALAKLSTNITTSGTLTFEWMPSAVGSKWCGPFVEYTEQDRLTNATLSVKLGAKELTSLKGQDSRSWTSVSVAIKDVSGDLTLSLASDARLEDEEDETGFYPVMIRNIKWTPEEDTPTPTITNLVQFVRDNVDWSGAEPSSTNVANGGTVTLPKVTAVTDYSFAGWKIAPVDAVDAEALRVDSEGFLLIDAAGRRVHEGTVVITTTAATNLTLTAVATNGTKTSTGWCPVTVRFVVDTSKGCRIGGGGVPVDAVAHRVTYRDESAFVTNKTSATPLLYGTALEPTVVGINGWDFKGWKIAEGARSAERAYGADGIVEVNGIADIPLSEDTTFEAVFEEHVYTAVYANIRQHNNPNPTAFVSTYDTNACRFVLFTNRVGKAWGGEWTGTYIPRLTQVGDVPDAAFAGWSPKALAAGACGFVDSTSGAFCYTNPVTQAQWTDMTVTTDNVYTVTFVWGVNGETSAAYAVRQGRNAVCTNDVRVAGYVFEGWDRPLDNVAASFETRAIYEPIRYPLSYANLMGAAHDNPETCTVEDAFALRAPKNGNENIQWLGWTTNGVAVAGIAAGTTNAISFTGNWAYRVTYRRTSGDHIESIDGQKSATSQKVNVYVADMASGTNFTDHAGSTNAPAVTCEAGYSFAGWQVLEPADVESRRALADEDGYLIDAAGRRVHGGMAIANVTQAMTLQAVATANVYTVTFDGGDGAVGEMDDLLFTYDVEQALTRNAFAKTGVTFAGWQCAEGLRVYADGEVVKNLATGGVVTLSAVWTNTVHAVVIDGVATSVAYGTTLTKSTVACWTNEEETVNAVCTGWIGAGSVPASGTSNTVAFVVTNASSLAWQYQTNYWVSAGVEKVGGESRWTEVGSVALSDAEGLRVSNPGWYLSGTNLVAEATPSDGWLFARWEGVPADASWTSASTSFTVLSPVSLTAVFTQKVYAVTFVAGEHLSPQGFVIEKVAHGGSVTLPEVTPDVGYSLAGWFDAEGRPVDAESLRVVTSDLALTAVATACVYTITYEGLPEGVTNNPANPATFTVTNAVVFAAPSVRAGYRFDGWTPAGITPGQMSNVTTRASWTKIWPVAFRAGEHVALSGAPTEQIVDHGGAATLPTATVDVGYSLAGWFDAEGNPVDAESLRVVTSDLALTAVATACVYTITYEGLQGATHANPTNYTIELVASAPYVFVAPDTPTNPAAGPFAGWTPDKLEQGSTGDVRVVASWGVTHRVEVTAKGEGAVALFDAAGRAVKNPGRYVEGTNLVAEATPSDGWLFARWEGLSDSVDADPVDAEALRVDTEEESSSSGRGEGAASTGTQTVVRVCGPVSLTAVFTQAVYSVTIGGVARDVRHGETVTVSTDANVTNGMTNVVCTGWIGSGSVPAIGTDSAVTFTVTNASSLAWQYQTNYWVSVGVEKVGGESRWTEVGSVALSDAEGLRVSNPGWYLSGTNLVAEATPSDGWLFARWEGVPDPVDADSVDAEALRVDTKEESSSSGRGEGAASTGTRTAVRVCGPVSLVAVFTQKVHTVTFELDEHLVHTGGGALVQTVAHGEAAALPTVRGIGYYALEGWYDADGRPVDAEALRVITASATYCARSVSVEPRIDAAVEDEYEPKIAIDPIAVRCVYREEATLKVAGLPGGLKFTAKPVTSKVTQTVGGKRVTTVVTNAPANSIYGTPSKSGLFTATVTATVTEKVGRKTVTAVVATTNLPFVVIARAKGETAVKTDVVLVDADFGPLPETGVIPGKTTGQGVYASGRKVTLKATANKGYVFSGWYGNAALVSRLASLALVVPAHDVAYTAAFVTTADDAASICAGVNGLALVSGGVAATTATNVSAGVYLQWPVAADALSATTVAVSGLPSGLKFTAKPVTSKVTQTVGGTRVTTVVTNVPAMTIYGTPTAASKVNAKTGAVTPSTVRVTVTTAGKNKVAGVIALTVDALPAALVGTFTGGSTNEPIGSATVTLASTGKISGKWVDETGTWTLKATGLDGIREGAEGARVCVATNVTATCGKLAETLTLVFSVDGLGYGTVDAEALRVETDPTIRFSATYVPWKTDVELKALAKELKGETFDASDAEGLRVYEGKVGANGTVSVKGTFVDAESLRVYTATVSSTLVPVAFGEARDRFELFLHYPCKKNKFEGYATRLVLVWDGETLSVEEGP